MNFLTRVNYMRSARYWIIFSVVLSIVSLVALFTLGLNKGIDFTGGNRLDIRFEQQVTNAQLEQAVSSLFTKEVQIQKADIKGQEAASAEFIVTTPLMDDETRGKLLKQLETLGPYTIVGEETVSGTVSKELTRNATLAIAIAAVLQVIYIWFRFEFRFGVTAVLALVHDVIITLGLMALFRVEVNAGFVGAILTVLGYSMNDTIVVIDRIRENLGRRRKGETLEALTTRSIQEVITRSLYTGVSVQMMLIAMLIWGGDTIWDFAMTLLIGITSGTYSSIFIASALWLFWHQWEDQKKRTAGTPARA